ncbi:unnamed protein product [Caretta caretta]
MKAHSPDANNEENVLSDKGKHREFKMNKPTSQRRRYNSQMSEAYGGHPLIQGWLEHLETTKRDGIFHGISAKRWGTEAPQDEGSDI